eukprot:GDKI01004194.1.p2 GENE.GDKI01004194.1~~GDKI01004194.1.p2  ORF type:complete len:100 (-),score=21.27 GDKI01004194.1:67-366(-)
MCAVHVCMYNCEHDFPTSACVQRYTRNLERQKHAHTHTWKIMEHLHAYVYCNTRTVRENLSFKNNAESYTRKQQTRVCTCVCNVQDTLQDALTHTHVCV